MSALCYHNIDLLQKAAFPMIWKTETDATLNSTLKVTVKETKSIDLPLSKFSNFGFYHVNQFFELREALGPAAKISY